MHAIQSLGSSATCGGASAHHSVAVKGRSIRKGVIVERGGDVQQPDDLGTGLAAAKGDNVPADGVVQQSALVLVGLSRMSEGVQRDRKMDLQSAKCSR